MRIVFTGGGTGGHFYPLIAVAEQVRAIAAESKLFSPEFHYIGPVPFDPDALNEQGIIFHQSPAGKIRRYFSVWNLLDPFKTFFGTFKVLWQLFVIYPDVIFSKGGYASVPTVIAGWLLRIPIVVHESDAAVGRANKFGSRLATYVAISYPETAEYFAGYKNLALTGNPVRGIIGTPTEGAHAYLGLSKNLPLILVVGGSQGAQRINNTILEALPELIKSYQVIHQTGKDNFEGVVASADAMISGNESKDRYKPFAYLDRNAVRMAYSAADIVISRAGSTTIAEIAAAKKPAIIIPIPAKYSHDQHKNAFAYARGGAATVVEENNLSPHILLSEIERILNDPAVRTSMGNAAATFSKNDAARTVAQLLVNIHLEHEA